jgi:hypothetical protein
MRWGFYSGNGSVRAANGNAISIAGVPIKKATATDALRGLFIDGLRRYADTPRKQCNVRIVSGYIARTA